MEITYNINNHTNIHNGTAQNQFRINLVLPENPLMVSRKVSTAEHRSAK